MNPTQQYTNSIKGTKSRSYSGRNNQPHSSDTSSGGGKDTTKLLKIKAQQIQEQNDYNEGPPVTYSVNTGRSKSTNNYPANDETPSHKGISIKVLPPSHADHRLLNQSPSQQQLLQENINTTNVVSMQSSNQK